MNLRVGDFRSGQLRQQLVFGFAARFQHQHAQAFRRELQRQRDARWAGADDAHVGRLLGQADRPVPIKNAPRRLGVEGSNSATSARASGA
jgi:hypothetical protein